MVRNTKHSKHFSSSSKWFTTIGVEMKLLCLWDNHKDIFQKKPRYESVGVFCFYIVFLKLLGVRKELKKVYRGNYCRRLKNQRLQTVGSNPIPITIVLYNMAIVVRKWKRDGLWPHIEIIRESSILFFRPPEQK